MTSKELPQRKKNRLAQYDYATGGAYFVTICLNDRQHILWNNANFPVLRHEDIRLTSIGKIVQQAIEQIPAHYPHIQVDKYCIMPDHIHLLLLFYPGADGRQIAAPTLSGVIGNMKRWVSMQLGFSIWQKSFFDRVIRNDAGYREVWQYIDENPLKMQLHEHHA